MILKVIVDTGEADQGYEEGEEPDFKTHRFEIEELLRSGYYNTKSIEVLE